MKKHILFALPLVFFSFLVSGQNFLTCQGNKLYDKCNNEVRLTGVNWFGFETSNKCPHGLWSRDYRSMLEQIKSLGFNCIRIPWCNAILDSAAQASGLTTSGTDPYNGRNPMNSDLQGLRPIAILDKIVAYCKTLGLKIILDHHSIQPDQYQGEPLWYTGSFTEQQWINDWVTVATRYNNNDVVIAFDLDNEPHDQATWGNSNAATDWNKAAERCANQILAVNPHALIMVEGVEDYGGYGYWWGGNLRGANSFPITINKPEKLVYSIHEYGPEIFSQTWFSDPSFPANMPAVWNDTYGYLYNNNTAPLYIGEFGIKDSAAVSGKAGTWFNAFLQYMNTKFSWTYWCMNPNSGDTGGILADDWITVNQWKVNKIKPCMAPLIQTCTQTGNADLLSPEQTFTVYPNPSKGFFSVQSGPAYSVFDLTVRNAMGQTVYSSSENSSSVPACVDLSDFPKGIYIVFISCKNETHIVKIALQ